MCCGLFEEDASHSDSIAQLANPSAGACPNFLQISKTFFCVPVGILREKNKDLGSSIIIIDYCTINSYIYYNSLSSNSSFLT